MTHKIKKIKGQLDDIVADKNKFNLIKKDLHKEGAFGTSNAGVSGTSSRETHSFLPNKTDVIGRQKDEEKIIALMRQTEGEKVSIIPIVGFAGLGKTTIAKSIYNDKRLDFNLRMWVCVSDDFDLKRLMVKIIKCVTKEDRSHLEVNQLQEDLRGILDGEKYLLVLDDVWNEDKQKWLDLKTLLVGDASGSKIIVTTRSNKVASIMGTVPSHTLQGLSDSDSWQLFVKFAFKEGEEKRPGLVNIGEEIVSKCKGVPLAIITLGSLLSSTRDRHEWEFVRDNDMWKLEQKESDILSALTLSYERLPSYLQRCIAYCSMFPKDDKIDTIQLVSFWMAHGLIKPVRENQELEHAGLYYLKELHYKCFFQTADEFPEILEMIGFFYFKIHDLVHDLALLVMQSEYSTINSDSQSISQLESVRHLKFLDSKFVTLHLSTFPCNWDRVRSLLFHCQLENERSNLAIHRCLLRVPYLRYLNLENCQLETLPKEIGRLKHLRFLSLKGNRKIRELPNSICKLQSLETLILDDCVELEELPSDMRYMISLRYLWITTKQRVLPMNGIGRLKSLRFLFIGGCKNLEYLFDDMQDLKFLRMLLIGRCDKLIRLPQSMRCLTALETLFIGKCENLTLSMEEPKDNEDFSHFSIQRLVIGGLAKVVELPEWLFQGSVNTLQFLYIAYCENLNELPESIKSLTFLQELHIEGCDQLSEKCEPKIGADWSKIAHIPKIIIDGEDVKATSDLDDDDGYYTNIDD